MLIPPLVSIVIPAYKPRHFRAAIESALSQTHPNCEILVSDNCPDDTIARMVRDYDGVEYSRNPETGYRNADRCYRLARGEFVKFLLDDDLLHPHCVTHMLGWFIHPSVTLVTSKRMRIDDAGRVLPDTLATRPYAVTNGVVPGETLADHMLERGLNVVGELTTAMFRRETLSGQRPFFWSFAGREHRCLGDVAAWISLLDKGDAVYLSPPLSQFRIHDGQNTERERRSGFPGHAVDWFHLVFDARARGLLADDKSYRGALNRLMSILPGGTPGYASYANAINDELLALERRCAS